MGLPGLYRVTLVLGRPGSRNFLENEVKFAEFLNGSSHLAMLAPAGAVSIRSEVRGPTGSFIFNGWPDSAGFLAKLESEPFKAKNRSDAHIRAMHAAQSLLSEKAAALDIPLGIDLIEVTEVATENKSLTLIAPFLSAGSSVAIPTYNAEFCTRRRALPGGSDLQYASLSVSLLS
jgi:hypothetical protein